MKICWNLAMLGHLKYCLLLLSSGDKDWMASPKPRIFLSGLYGKSLPTIILGYSLDNVSIFI